MSAQPGRMEQWALDLNCQAIGIHSPLVPYLREQDAEAEQQRALIAELAAALEGFKVAWERYPLDYDSLAVVYGHARAALARVEGKV